MLSRLAYGCLAAVLLLGCATAPPAGKGADPTIPPSASSSEPSLAALRIVPDPESASLIAAQGLRGTFVLYDASRRRLSASDPALADKAYIPASTFKIPNTLIGLEVGVINGKDFALKWDGQDKGRPEWNQDQDLASAMKHSAVWYYQEIARRIGQQRMAEYVKRFAYGNQDLGGGIDLFWLAGALRISPRGQVEFLERLRTRALPVSKRSMDIVDEITTLEASDGWVWRGKTGTQVLDGAPSVAWLVGSAERAGKAWVYALLLLGDVGRAPASPADRRKIVRVLLDKAAK